MTPGMDVVDRWDEILLCTVCVFGKLGFGLGCLHLTGIWKCDHWGIMIDKNGGEIDLAFVLMALIAMGISDR